MVKNPQEKLKRASIKETAKRETIEGKADKLKNSITIIIPCKNEGMGVIEVLNLLELSQLGCNIIIADSSDDVSSIALLKEYQLSHQNVSIIPGGLPAVARNNGAKMATTPYILFLDADIYIKDLSLIRTCLGIIHENKYDLVTVKFKTLERKYNWVYRLFDIIQYMSAKTKPFALGGFMMFNNKVFKKLGGFNELDKIAEDYHLSSKIKPNKFKIVKKYAYTTGRRFEKKGVAYMIKLAWKSWLNRNNDNFFKKDYNYWS